MGLCDDYYYVWSLSFSPQDGSVQTAPAAVGPVTVYLWFWCAADDGMTAAEFSAHTTGSLSVVDFTPMNGYVNFGTATQLLLNTDCRFPAVVAGAFTLFDSSGAGGQACLALGMDGINVTVDCGQPTPSAWPNGYRGVSTDGLPACTNVLPVEPTSWGAVKSLYR